MFIIPASLTLNRWMPPTGPKGNMPRVAIVFARLMVNGENRGVRPFVVALGDGKQMCKGVSSKYVRFIDPSNPLFHQILTIRLLQTSPSTCWLKAYRPLHHLFQSRSFAIRGFTGFLGDACGPKTEFPFCYMACCSWFLGARIVHYPLPQDLCICGWSV